MTRSGLAGLVLRCSREPDVIRRSQAQLFLVSPHTAPRLARMREMLAQLLASGPVPRADGEGPSLMTECLSTLHNDATGTNASGSASCTLKPPS